MTTRSKRPPAASTRASAPTASVASSSSVWSQTPSAARAASAAGERSAATTRPLAPSRSRACTATSAPDLPAPSTSTRWPGRAWRATSAGAPQTSSAASARVSGRSSGSRAQSPVAKRMAWPRHSTRSISGRTAVMASSRSGVRVSETRVAIAVAGAERAGGRVARADGADPADEHAARAGDRVLQLAALGDDARDLGGDGGRIAPHRRLDLPERGGVDVERLDVDAELVLAEGEGGVEPLGPLGEHAGGRDDAPESVGIHAGAA